ncbi:MAG: metal-dependent hydrolase [Desulfovibrionaceae bacterium]|nr:metal-dependent hydrolase [Desulfovibrionaceae bacterium]
MRWITHQGVAVMAAIALGMPAPAVAATWAGAVLPDVMDQKIAAWAFRNKQAGFNKVHRGATHWFGLWLALWLGALFIGVPEDFLGMAAEVWHSMMAGLGFGGLTHVLLDMCTPAGVPMVPWSRKNKVSLNLCKTGSWGEYAFLGGSFLLFIIFFQQEAWLLWYIVSKKVL